MRPIYGYSIEEPEEFSKTLPELTFVEGTGENAGFYAVKIGEELVSDYVYTEEFGVAKDGDLDFSLGNIILGVAINKDNNNTELWMNTKTSSAVISLAEGESCWIEPSRNGIDPSSNGAFLTVCMLNEKGNYDFIIFDWSGNEIVSLELENDNDVYNNDVYINKINTHNQDFLQVDINTDDGTVIRVYDLEGNKVLETENEEWIYAFQFGMLEIHSDTTKASKIVDIKNNVTISDVVETNHIDLYATTAKLKKTSEDYLAPGKYYFMTDDEEVYEMTISYTTLEGANSSVDKTSTGDLTVKVDGDLEKLEGIYVDNEKLAESNYTLEAGSTIVTLKNEYLKTLGVGEHTLKIKYLDGEVETKFTITETIENGEKDDEPKMGIAMQENNIVFYIVTALFLVLGVAFIAKKK